METNSFTGLKLHTPISNLKLKKMVSYLNLFLLYEEFSSMRVSTLILFYIAVAEVHVIFTDTETKIKEVQIGHHEIKQ